jgi:hypothetical protein
MNTLSFSGISTKIDCFLDLGYLADILELFLGELGRKLFFLCIVGQLDCWNARDDKMIRGSGIQRRESDSKEQGISTVALPMPPSLTRCTCDTELESKHTQLQNLAQEKESKSLCC